LISLTYLHYIKTGECPNSKVYPLIGFSSQLVSM